MRRPWLSGIGIAASLSLGVAWGQFPPLGSGLMMSEQELPAPRPVPEPMPSPAAAWFAPSQPGTYGYFSNPRQFPTQSGNYAEVDFVLLWAGPTDLPPLLTSNPPGTPLDQIGVPGVFGNQTVSPDQVGADAHPGMQIRVGHRTPGHHFSRFDVGAWYMAELDETYEVDNCCTILSRPFIDAETGLPDAQIIRYPGIATGNFSANYQRELWGFDPTLYSCLWGCEGRNLECFIGYRYLNLDDSLTLDEVVYPLEDPLIIEGTSLTVRDRFKAANDLHLIPIGLDWDQFGDLWGLSLRGGVGFGVVDQVVKINGSTRVDVPDDPDSPTIYEGGFYALSSNIGRHDRTRFAWVPQLTGSLQRRLGETWVVKVGYQLTYLNDVVTAPGQIDTVIDTNLLPPPDPAGGLRPRVPFRSEGLLIHGLHVGLVANF